MPKYAVHHHRHWLRMGLARFFSRHDRAEVHKKNMEAKANAERDTAQWVDPDGLTDKDKMLSLDV